jgi:peptidoglycan/xylan/chitin deacetylase (PgdA/CDA1 family)
VDTGTGTSGEPERADGAPDGVPSGSRRRDWLLRGAFGGLGVALGVAGLGQLANVRDRKLPLLPSAQSATVGNLAADGGRGQLRVTWQGQSDGKLIALTFDDGPRPQWTTLVLDILDQYQIPATFFMVGRRLRKYASVVQGRLDRHEVGNHTWDHVDLARRTQDEAYRDLTGAHEAIVTATGRVPTLFRPPYGHFGGSAVLAADRLDYEMILWSLQMQEGSFPHDPDGHARHMAKLVTPNTILLAHDVDADGRDRRVAIDGLPLLFELLLGQGYQFVTVSQLLNSARVAPQA